MMNPAPFVVAVTHMTYAEIRSNAKAVAHGAGAAVKALPLVPLVQDLRGRLHGLGRGVHLPRFLPRRGNRRWWDVFREDDAGLPTLLSGCHAILNRAGMVENMHDVFAGEGRGRVLPFNGMIAKPAKTSQDYGQFRTDRLMSHV